MFPDPSCELKRIEADHIVETVMRDTTLTTELIDFRATHPGFFDYLYHAQCSVVALDARCQVHTWTWH